MRCVEALRRQQGRQLEDQLKAGARWTETELVLTAAGLDDSAWTPREMRHSFVSLLSDSGLPIEHISRLVGHSGTSVTETVYRQQIRPVMDRIFPLLQASDALSPS